MPPQTVKITSFTCHSEPFAFCHSEGTLRLCHPEGAKRPKDLGGVIVRFFTALRMTNYKIWRYRHMRKVAAIGVGMTKFSGKQDKTTVELFAEAAIDAINEANLKPKDIQALFMGNALGDFAEGQA